MAPRKRGGGRKGGQSGGKAIHEITEADTSPWDVVVKCSTCQADGCPVKASVDAAKGTMELSVMRAELEAVLRWFQFTVVAADNDACLTLPPTKDKYARAFVHRVVTHNFPGLQTVSSGVGDARTLGVYKHGRAPAKEEATGEAGARAARLYAYMAAAGRLSQVSRDEVVEMMASGEELPEDLARVWEAGEAQQAMLAGLMAAVAADDGDAVRALAEAQPAVQDAVVSGVKDALTGETPLHAAARMGAVGAVRALVEVGANLEATNSQGRTPLKVSRVFEQTEAEGVLLQLGALDPEAHRFPLNPVAARLGADTPPRQLATAAATPPDTPVGPSPTDAAAGSAAGAPQGPGVVGKGGEGGAAGGAAAPGSGAGTGCCCVQVGAWLKEGGWVAVAAAVVAVGAVAVMRYRKLKA